MTNEQSGHEPGKLSAYLTAVANEIEKLPGITSAEVLHGKFKIADLDRISFRAPAAFVSVVLADPQIQHAGQVRLACQFAIMLVTKTGNVRQDPFALSLACLSLIHRNVFGFKKISQPGSFNILPVLTGDERTKGQALTALTWKQDITVIDPEPGTRDVDQVVHADGTIIYDRQNSEDPSGADQ